MRCASYNATVAAVIPPGAPRVRYAPSPTGPLHVGGVRTALLNFLYARATGGVFVLRVEDTDAERSRPEHEAEILETLDALGLAEDEGPRRGGAHGPYRQSERGGLYADLARDLRDRGDAYYCFCDPDLLTRKREAALKLGKTPHYDGTCARLTRAEAERRLAAGEAAGLRYRARADAVALVDEVRGRVEFGAGSVGDFFITRAFAGGVPAAGPPIGVPVYNFACVADDHAMAMTHVIRGEDHLANTARQLQLYAAFGWAPPKFAHLAMVLGADRQKLSKRNGDVGAREYLAQGYSPEGLLGFLALLGWTPPASEKPRSGHPDVWAMDELRRIFRLEGLHKAPAVFDADKLRFINAHQWKGMSDARFLELARPWLAEFPGLPQAAALAFKDEIHLLADLREELKVVMPGGGALADDARAAVEADREAATRVARAWIEELRADQAAEAGASGGAEPAARAERFAAMPKRAGERAGVKGRQLFLPIRVLLTGRAHGPELKKLYGYIGPAEALGRADALRGILGL